MPAAGRRRAGLVVKYIVIIVRRAQLDERRVERNQLHGLSGVGVRAVV